MTITKTRPRARRAVSPPPARIIRKLSAAERSLLGEHLLRLSPYDRTMRFMSTVNDGHILRYAQHSDDYQRLVLGYFADGALRGAGELIFLTNPVWRGACEAALSVETPWQHLGVGTELLRRLVLLARNRGAAPVQVYFLRENRRMQGLARKLGMSLTYTGAEVAAQLYPTWPTYLSLLGESFSDGHAAWARLARAAHTARG
ncbi:MAG: GNAT family N-acetyltransferase [Gammaproteobacteria bacterium]